MKKRNILDNKFIFIIILIFLIIGATFSAIYVKEFVGFVVSVSSRAGYITKLIIEQRTTTSYWQGFYGLALMQEGYDETQYEEAYPGEIESKHLIFECLEPNVVHEVYASLVDPTTLDWASVQPATSAWVDDYFNITPSEHDSATNTFTQDGHIVIGADNITNVPLTYTKKYGSSGSTDFNLGILNVSGDLVFFTQVATIQTGFNNQNLNYQMVLPAPNTTLYYFFTDPNDVCPAGYGTGQLGDGYITGSVIDNSTNQTLENVTIGIGGQSNLTDSNGFFNITVPIGYQYIVAIKDGYYTHTALVNITLYSTTEHNISMTPFTGLSAGETGLGNGTIQGTVTNNRTNLVLANVTVHAGVTTFTTDENGFYNGSTYEGNYTIVALLDEYENYIGFVNIIEDNTTVYNISMEPTTGTVGGFAIDNSTGSSLSGVLVGIGDQTTLTNSSGAYSITVRTGKHFIVGTKSGYENYANNLTVIAGTTIQHNITMVSSGVGVGTYYENGTVEGYVVDNSTQIAISNVTVTIAGVSRNTNGSGFYNMSMCSLFSDISLIS